MEKTVGIVNAAAKYVQEAIKESGYMEHINFAINGKNKDLARCIISEASDDFLKAAPIMQSVDKNLVRITVENSFFNTKNEESLAKSPYTKTRVSTRNLDKVLQMNQACGTATGTQTPVKIPSLAATTSKKKAHLAAVASARKNRKSGQFFTAIDAKFDENIKNIDDLASSIPIVKKNQYTNSFVINIGPLSRSLLRQENNHIAYGKNISDLKKNTDLHFIQPSDMSFKHKTKSDKTLGKSILLSLAAQTRPEDNKNKKIKIKVATFYSIQKIQDGRQQAESTRLLNELVNHLAQKRFVYLMAWNTPKGTHIALFEHCFDRVRKINLKSLRMIAERKEDCELYIYETLKKIKDAI